VEAHELLHFESETCLINVKIHTVFYHFASASGDKVPKTHHLIPFEKFMNALYGLHLRHNHRLSRVAVTPPLRFLGDRTAIAFNG